MLKCFRLKLRFHQIAEGSLKFKLLLLLDKRSSHFQKKEGAGQIVGWAQTVLEPLFQDLWQPSTRNRHQNILDKLDDGVNTFIQSEDRKLTFRPMGALLAKRPQVWSAFKHGPQIKPFEITLVTPRRE